ncbi:MAG: AAA family ATPase [Chloroflexota bacterium]|nr:AAA family ATPase [Chloroflexota bacterium]MDE3192502.1 AAA family ATPase [Chloroflexota bacterium]
MTLERPVTDDLGALLRSLPPYLDQRVRGLDHLEGLLEIVMDLGRLPEARFVDREENLSDREVSPEDIAYVMSRIGQFGGDNRAGIERTLHRISALRNRAGKVVGLTLRVGRAVYGTVDIIRDVVEAGKSVLLVGRPGVGKTTLLREAARVLADELGKRVVVVDTSNEIAGDGDIPHPGIGRARRMQVQTPALQHAVMIEAVENHMPEVIVIDEIGTEQEAAAARTIAERGVQLIATAHGNSLENLMLNPTLSDLVGGIQTVTLSDEEARRRGTQKSVLERKAPPTFQVLVEIQAYQRMAIYLDVAQIVDAILLGVPVAPEIRERGADGQVEVTSAPPRSRQRDAAPGDRRIITRPQIAQGREVVKVYPFGISWSRVEEAARGLGLPIAIVREPDEADVVITLKNYYRRKTPRLRDAEQSGIPIFIARSNSVTQIASALASVFEMRRGPEDAALEEAREAIDAITGGQAAEVELSPQPAGIRRLQHELAERAELSSSSSGHEPYRRVQIYR